MVWISGPDTHYYGHQILDIRAIKNFAGSSLSVITFSFMWSSNACGYGGWQGNGNGKTVEFFYAGMNGYTIKIYKKS